MIRFKEYLLKESEGSLLYAIVSKRLRDGEKVLADFTVNNEHTRDHYVGHLSIDDNGVIRVHGTVNTTLLKFDHKVSTGQISDKGYGLKEFQNDSADDLYRIKKIGGDTVVVDRK